MDIRWILRDKKDFLSFVTILEKFERDNLFQTDFMKSLAHEYWMGYLKRIIGFTLIPWIAYSVVSLIYFAYTLDQSFESIDGADLIFWQVVALILLILVFY